MIDEQKRLCVDNLHYIRGSLSAIKITANMGANINPDRLVELVEKTQDRLTTVLDIVGGTT